MTEVRTRFSPSPTGFQHVGGIRTAFYAYLLAKHFGGKFLLRIEDTDRERLVPGATRFLIEELKWFGVTYDEGPSKKDLEALGESWDGAPDVGGPHGPYVQSLRSEKYVAAADVLVEKGFAYRCDCTPEMLERERNEQLARKELPGYTGYCRDRNVSKDVKHVVRFRMPSRRSVTLMDAVKGRVTWDNVSLRDTVLLKSIDGMPTYHLAVVVDDHDMQITHVLRGDEWLSTAPLHVLLYEAFGWQAPVFAHLPVINGNDGKKLSKRRGAPSSNILREEGYLPEALLNYVTMVGWSPGEGDEQEIFSREELIKRFSLERVNNACGIYDPNKLNWMNGLYIRNLSNEEFVVRAIPYLAKAGIELSKPEDKVCFEAIAPLVKERVRTLVEIAPMVDFLFKEKIERDIPSMYQKGIDAAVAKTIIDKAIECISSAKEFVAKPLEEALRPFAEQLGIKPGPVFGVIRIAVTGKKVTPPLFESIVALGREKTLQRLRETLELIATK